MKKLTTGFAKSVWKKIKSQKVSQTPSWFFTLRESLFWITYITSILFGGLLLAVLYTFYQTTTEEIFTTGMDTDLEFLSPTEFLPTTWIILFVIMTALAIFSFKKTTNGYKFPKIWFIFFNIILSVGVGITALHFSALKPILNTMAGGVILEKELDQEYFAENAQTPDGKYQALKGIIVEIQIKPKTIKLEDANKKTWTVELPLKMFSEIATNQDKYLLSYQEFLGENLPNGNFKVWQEYIEHNQDRERNHDRDRRSWWNTSFKP